MPVEGPFDVLGLPVVALDLHGDPGEFLHLRGGKARGVPRFAVDVHPGNPRPGIRDDSFILLPRFGKNQRIGRFPVQDERVRLGRPVHDGGTKAPDGAYDHGFPVRNHRRVGIDHAAGCGVDHYLTADGHGHLVFPVSPVDAVLPRLRRVGTGNDPLVCFEQFAPGHIQNAVVLSGEGEFTPLPPRAAPHGEPQ